MGPPDSGRVSRVPPYLGSRQAASRFRVRGSHPLWPAFPDRSPIARRAMRRSRNPREQALGFRLLRFRSPLLTQSRLMSSPAGTEMFHFPASRPRGLCVQPRVMGHNPHRIAPFGNPRIAVCLPLPEAYRSLPRPSSPDGAKASIVRPYTLSRSAFGQNQKRPPLGLRCILPRNVHLPKIKNPLVDQTVVGVPGIEPGTSSLSGTRSNQLSYTPISSRDAWSGRGATVSCLRQGAHLATPSREGGSLERR